MTSIMFGDKTENFSGTLKNFKTKIEGLRAAKKDRLVLIIMSNTHDPTLCIGCEKDAAAIKKTFEEICDQTDYNFCCIEISGKNYSNKNLFKAFDNMGTHNDVTVFYYSGHGYSYQNDSRYRYPQLDMRSHNTQADFNKIDFIEQHTENLKALLLMMMWRAGRVNIAIADCCNTSIPFKRKKASATDMEIAEDVMVRVSKKFTQQLYADNNNMVSIMVSSSTQGQPAITDNEIGSIFTDSFTKTIKSLLSKKSNPSQYFPWVKVLKTTAEKAFKESNKYNIGNGIAGKQKAVFEVFIESDSDYAKRMNSKGW
ncbi:caspase family protein [Ferruginibacter sp.]|uniref:caspase family protein n=1 Tax=Ferruginibacter sp. TaxID=1940288 RepID=UPI00198D640C|nr:caspase family protein [Ferruginibacter sp.]MBC7626998.1 caspase family protein [Ferruginibacter sp.]